MGDGSTSWRVGLRGIWFGTGRLDALEDAALVVEFGGDDSAGQSEGEVGIESALVLEEAGESVVIFGWEELAEEASFP